MKMYFWRGWDTRGIGSPDFEDYEDVPIIMVAVGETIDEAREAYRRDYSFLGGTGTLNEIDDEPLAAIDLPPGIFSVAQGVAAEELH